MARSKGAKRQSGGGVDRERRVLGVLLISLSLLVALGLFQSRLGELSDVDVRRVNRAVSHFLTGLLGLSAWIVPILLVQMGWNRISGSDFRASGRALLLAVTLVITVSVLCYSTGMIPLDHQGEFGGSLGKALYSLADQSFGALGTTLIALTFLLVVLIWLYDLALPRLETVGLRDRARQIPGYFRSFAVTLREKLLLSYETAVEWIVNRRGDPALIEEEEEYEDAIEVVDEDEEDKTAGLSGAPPQIVKPVKAIKAKPSKLIRRPLGPMGDKEYLFPPIDLLADDENEEPNVQEDYLLEQSRRLEDRLADFGVKARVIEVHPGPVITRFELEPAPGVKVQQIANLADDLALVMRAKRIRIVAPIPGKGAVGVEIPNLEPRTVFLKEILTSAAFARGTSKLTIAMGKDISGQPFYSTLEEMPHLLIAGATGSGKSVCIHSILASILYGASPEEVHLILIDPKMLEMTMYNGIPHLLAPVVTDAKEASQILRWAVFEMQRRYKLLARVGVRGINDYNKNLSKLQASQEIIDEGLELEALPYLVIVIDEFADLILTAPNEIEDSVARLAQMARAVGIHLVLATQRPSVNVITGVIKANFPSRIAFQVASKIDSRTIIDGNGAEKLLGKGDMLFVFAGRPEINRIHGAFITTEETNELVMFLKEQGYEAKNKRTVILDDGVASEGGSEGGLSPHEDELFDEAARIVIRSGQGSVSLLQRRLRVGYSRAARLVDLLEQAGIVGPFEGSKARDVLVDEEWLRQKEEEDGDENEDEDGENLPLN